MNLQDKNKEIEEDKDNEKDNEKGIILGVESIRLVLRGIRKNPANHVLDLHK